MADEYIKRSDALTVIERFNGYLDDDMQYRIKFMLNRDCPAADVVEVVRCRECKHFHAAKDSFGWCENIESPAWDRGVDNDWFCADGERREVQDGR